MLVMMQQLKLSFGGRQKTVDNQNDPDNLYHIKYNQRTANIYFYVFIFIFLFLKGEVMQWTDVVIQMTRPQDPDNEIYSYVT